MHTKDFVNDWISCGTIFSTDSEKVIIAWGKRKWFSNISESHPCFYFPDFFLKDATPWFTNENYCVLTITQLVDLLSAVPDSIPQKPEWHNSHRSFFNKAFTNLQKKISSGELKKAVPFVTETAETTMDTPRLVKSLKSILEYIQKNPAFVYGFWDEKEGMLGATPETLFRCTGDGLLDTMACAGTKKLSEDNSSLLSDPKELYEHDLVVQGIVQSLSPYGKVTKGNLQLLKLTQLMHLVTPLSLELQNQIPFQDLVNALHPTPALGAFPKENGMHWLQEYQQHITRSRFGAPAGYFLPETKHSNCYVAIRNIQWNHKHMHISAGCGVVADSHCHREWDEINLKLNAIKKMLDL